jgi:sporulation protein YunB
MVRVIRGLKRKLTSRQKLFAVFFSFLLFLFMIFSYLNTSVNPIIIAVSEAQIRAMSIKAVNNAISSVMQTENVYNNLVTIQEDDEGNISLIQANTLEINKLTNDLMIQTQAQIETMGEEGVSVPIGSFSGLPVLNGIGPNVKLKLFPVGNVECGLINEFNTAGINQTNHRIYVDLQTRISLVLPLETQIITTAVQLLITESIIIGEVPEVYLDSHKLDESLNLIP